MRRAGVVVALAAVAASCAADPGVSTDAAHRFPVAGAAPTAPPTAATTTTVTTPTTATAPGGEEPPPTNTGGEEPPPTNTGGEEPPPTSTGGEEPPPIESVLDVGDSRSSRPEDGFFAAVLVDVQRWWQEQYPVLYGEEFEPLRGGIYAAYPERRDPIPGCGREAETSYEMISEFGAFYCVVDDFVVFDDGDDGVLAGLKAELGPSILGVVAAHEFAHAVQARAGVLGRALPTIVGEQQADCFAGAWVGRAARGEAPGVPFSDLDVRSALIAMIAVRDPVGVDQFTEGGHGSAFDRVGAFQVGFGEGPARCAELIDDPLPLVPNDFLFSTNSDGNAPWGYGSEAIVGIVEVALNSFWPDAIGDLGAATLGPLTVVPARGALTAGCRDAVGDPGVGAVYCPSTGAVLLDDDAARARYDDFGDFAVGYMLGTAWSEAVQDALGDPLAGEERALLGDCLTGAWAGALIPPRAEGPFIEPGDLDEAIQTALLVGDESSSDDVRGSGFEKIASFRSGVLGGITACTARLGD